MPRLFVVSLLQFLFEMSRAAFQSNPVVVAPHPFIISPVSGEELAMLELESSNLVFVFPDQAPGFQTLQQALQVRMLKQPFPCERHSNSQDNSKRRHHTTCSEAIIYYKHAGCGF